MNFKVALIGSLLGLILGYAYELRKDHNKLEPEIVVTNKRQVLTNDPNPSFKIIELAEAEKPTSDDPTLDLANAESIVAYIAKNVQDNSNYSSYSDSRLRQLSPLPEDLAIELFSKLIDIETRTLRDQLVTLIQTQGFASEVLSPKLLEKLQTKQNFKEWLEIGSQLYLNSEPLTDFLIENLNYSNDVTVIDSSINVLIRGFDNTQNMASPEQRKKIRAMVNQFRNHEKPTIRASVVNSYYKFPPANLETELFAAMQDLSPSVRSTAMNIASRRLNESVQLKGHMISILDNPTLHHMERLNASLSLKNMYLNSSEVTLVNKITVELDHYASTLSPLEGQQLAQEYYAEDN